ncbi:CHAT domain-containing protein [Streptomyces sp. HPF1205]|uniref:CHAT domain-containing protein n=1 Tax=Streptomyces sp. HPF1205 TaxID=2873262 RepID=UPI0027DF9122|nr:CHAT domain-containing protein [Streptomyces sp. HPF1205]
MTVSVNDPGDDFEPLRRLAAHSAAGSPEQVIAALELAQRLILRSADGDAAGSAIVTDAAEALVLLDGVLIATVPGSAFHRWAALLSARAIQLVCGEGTLDAAIRFFGIALAAAPHWSLPAGSTDPATATDDPQEWTGHNVAQSRCELAVVLWERWTAAAPAEARTQDRDRVVTLLAEALSGPYAAELADPHLLHATLGLALAGRSRAPDADSPERLADRAAALRHLHKAYRMGGATEEGPEPSVTFNLAMLLFFDHDERCDPASPPPEDLGRLIAPVLALADDPGEDGAMALELCAMLARDRCGHDGRREYESALEDIYRRQIAHPGTSPGDARGARMDLALLLIDRAEAGGAGTEAAAVHAHGARKGTPDPQTDLQEAADHFERIEAELRGPTPPGESASDRHEERVNCLNVLVELLSAWLRTGDEDDRLDRLVLYGKELVETIPADDEVRGLICLKIGVALAQRVQRRAGPHLYRQWEHLMSAMVPDPGLALARLAPGAREDSARAIELLRMGVGFHHYQDELYMAGAQALSVCLLIDHMLVLPHGDPAVLREAVRWTRVVLGRVPAGSDQSMEEYEFFVIHALAFSVWDGSPFTPPTGSRRLAALTMPDVSRHPSIEDGLHLLEQLLEAALARGKGPDPAYVLLQVMVEFIRGEPLTEGYCRAWWGRLDKLLRAGVDEPILRVLLSLFAAGFGTELVDRGAAGPEERAQVARLVDEASSMVPAGSELYHLVAGLRRRGAGAAGMLKALFGTAAGRASGSTDSGAPRMPSTTAPPPDPTSHHPLPTRRPAGTGRTGTTSATDFACIPDLTGIADPGDSETSEILRIAAVLPGDGSPYPFSEPVGRVLEIAEEARAAADEAVDRSGRAVAVGVTALARYDRWIHERETEDLTRAIAAANEAINTAGSVEPLGTALTALRAGMLLDRHTLLGDRMDLDAARDTYAFLLSRVADRSEHPGLVALLRRRAEAAGQPRLGAVLLDVPPLAAGDFQAGVAAAAATAALMATRAHQYGGAGARAAETRRIGDRLREVLRRLPEGHPRRPAARSEVGLVGLDLALAAGDRTALDAALGDVVGAAAECSPLSAHRPGLLLRAAVLLSAHQAGAPERLDLGIQLLSGALPDAERGFHGGRSRCLYGLGRLLLARFARAGRREDLTRAVDVLREARMTLDSPPGDAFSIVLGRAQAQAHRAHGRGDSTQRRWSRETAKSVLAAHGRAVLLQTGTARALAAAQAAGPDMLRLVRWCMEDGETAAALDALELGRGLVLNAATVAATVPALLHEAGQADLAAEWEAMLAAFAQGSATGEAGSGTASAPGAGPEAAAPDGLRRRVLEALQGGPAEARVLSAPTQAEVGRALRRVGADALVYLVPGEDGPGHALIVTATGAVESLPLRALNAAAGRPLAEYADALGTFQAAALGVPAPPGPRDPPLQQGIRDRAEQRAQEAQERWGTALETVCSWAGEVAMTKVLRWARERRPGRLPRLVLAPVGLLGVVPWQAARVAGPAGPDYAGRLAVLSQCATARQFMEAAGRQRLPWDGRQAFVVDPDGSSVMHEEARLIRSAFYPRATVAGSLGWLAERDGPWTGPAPVPATAEAVLPLLPGRSAFNAPGVAVCHINCHATPAATTAQSRLDLSRGHRLAIAELLTAARDPYAPGGLVVLANCVSDLALSAHDEALTLSTALLSTGAASVVGSRWSVVDDRRTSVLMYMFHHYLTGHGHAENPAAAGSPADALRAAQLWMLDPQRTVPAALRDIAVDTPSRPFDSPRIWAAFAHHGR